MLGAIETLKETLNFSSQEMKELSNIYSWMKFYYITVNVSLDSKGFRQDSCALSLAHSTQ